jgi:hypothetical protein
MNHTKRIEELAEHARLVSDYYNTHREGAADSWLGFSTLTHMDFVTFRVEKFRAGETFCEVSKLPHLAHASFHLMNALARTTPISGSEMLKPVNPASAASPSDEYQSPEPKRV